MKNKFLKVFGVLLTAVFIVCLMAITASAAEEPVRYGGTTLSGNAKYVYDRLIQGVNKETPDATISFESSKKITPEEFEQGVDVFVSDYPDSFWMRKKYSYAHSGGYIVSITPDYCFSGTALKTAREELDAVVEQIMASLPDGSNYEKALYLHDLLADRVEYELEGQHQIAYGALVSGKAVCAGYAAAYHLLLREAGIQAWTVTGTSKDPVKNEDIAHAWNVVWLDEDTCVYVDVTWDDQGDSIYHYYFGISKQEIAEDHTVAAEKFILPECSHDDLSYFDNSERVVDENTTAAELAELFGPSINNRRTAIIYYDGSIPFSTWISGISGSVYNKLDGGGFTYSYESANINKEIHLSFMGTFPPMTYSVNISAGANIATVAKLSQYVEISNEMTAVVFNAEDGYYFPSDYAFSKNGVSVIRNSSRQITVCGIPTANTQIVLPAATAMTKSAKPSATVVATGSDSAVLSGVSAGMKYSLGGSVWTDVTSSADILLTGIEPCDIYIVTKGNGEDKLDSDAQVISITQHSTPKVNVTDPTTADGKGSIATENIHEYSLDGENWITCTGALEGLDVGTYYVRVKASGSVLASETQLAIVHEYNFIKVSDISVVGSLTLYTGKSEMLVVSISPENADDKRVIFTSDNESVATVDENGKIIAISKGKAIITVTLVDGGLTAECAVEVLCEHDTSGEWQFDDDRHWRVCSKCGEDIDVGAHSFGEWVIISMPTDSEDGVRERSCVCGHSEDQRFYFEKNDATEKPNSYDPGEKDTARAQFGLGCFSAIGSASYLVLIPCLISAFALKRKKEE